MAFYFNFSNVTDEQYEDKDNNCEETCDTLEHFTVPCEYISWNDIDLEAASTSDVNLKQINFKDFKIKYIAQDTIANKIENLDLFSERETDLIPGKYEGGLKVWECSIDLAKYLSENSCVHSDDVVLELGCGIGLPGLISYLYGGLVTFQDYNSEVIKYVTASNVWLNTCVERQNSISEKCKFLCGDWQNIQEKYFSNGKDTKLSNQKKLLNLMKEALKPGGVIYLASKIHYFGVGGGIADFEKLLKEDNTFDFCTVFKVTEGKVH
ncbi:histidine protein methyltransferase 1 homolog [Trichonephila inaurata madagascariensis]|uniref:protein-histidine N-methyltransferase n=1 Tax=Trichonephila inaurata madagascariensis TaxID=2747483 RepID=A0A8X6JCD4_9ARAC|nr:histidine protein methyltransferase 1 homolog [Trichonephila inaurata madagascariensis]